MPYAQAARLPCFRDYLDAVGASDIKELPYGAGQPPAEDPEVFVGAIQMEGFACHISAQGSENSPPTTLRTMFDLAEFTASTTGRKFFTGPVPDPQNWDTKFNSWNAKHNTIKRVSNEAFVLIGQGQQTGTHMVVSAKQVALFVTHNEDLWYNKNANNYDSDPLGYAYFAMHLSSFDQSTDLWAFYDVKESRYVYPQADSSQSELATWGSWFVHPQHIGEYRVPGRMVLVSKERKELIDRQFERNILQRDEVCRKRDFDRKARDFEPYPMHKNKNDMCAAISARSRETRDDVCAANTAAKPGSRRNNAAAPALVPVPVQPAPVQVQLQAPAQPLANVSAHDLRMPVTPAQIFDAGSAQSTAQYTPPITTLDPMQLMSHNDLSDPVTNLPHMTDEEFMTILGTASGQVVQAEDTEMGGED
ncbi:hypothetical protein B0H13DRAFT_2379473 [Mycena leptocephala]|nr:hypothetical protein B0H13DRAFT_2379473 [Mycena leptocephala]